MATQHVSDFSKSQEQILLDLINAANGTNLPLTALTIAKKDDLPNGKATATASANRFSGYKNAQTFGYSQIDFDDAVPTFMGGGRTVIASTVNAGVKDILNAAFNIQLKELDLQLDLGGMTPDFTEGTVNIIRIVASDESLIWDGDMDIEIRTVKIDDVLSYVVRFANTRAGFGVIPFNASYTEDGDVQLSEDGKIIIGG